MLRGVGKPADPDSDYLKPTMCCTAHLGAAAIGACGDASSRLIGKPLLVG
jgi:hypothetical protein